MAIWQVPLQIIKKNNASAWTYDTQLENCIKIISPILKKEESWSEDTEQYGDIESTCVEFIFDDNHEACEICIRIDVTTLKEKELDAIIDFINEVNGLILYNDKIFSAKKEVLIEIIDNSPSAKFYENPHKFLEGIEKSPIIDEY